MGAMSRPSHPLPCAGIVGGHALCNDCLRHIPNVPPDTLRIRARPTHSGCDDRIPIAVPTTTQEVTRHA